MTWKTRKYREISEIFARFAILTKFLSIEFLQTWQLLKTSEDTTFGWVLWNFYVPIWKYDLENKEISWNQRIFCQICNFYQVLFDRIPSTWQLSKTSEDTTFGWVLWNFYVPIWRYDLKHNEISWNQRNFCQICNFYQVFFDRISPNLAIIKNIWRHNFWVSFVKFLRANLKVWLETQQNIVKLAKFLPDLQF